MHTHSIQGECVLVCEIKTYASLAYRKNCNQRYLTVILSMPIHSARTVCERLRFDVTFCVKYISPKHIYVYKYIFIGSERLLRSFYSIFQVNNPNSARFSILASQRFGRVRVRACIICFSHAVPKRCVMHLLLFTKRTIRFVCVAFLNENPIPH